MAFLRRYLPSPAVAHVLPLVLFMLISSVLPLVKVENEMLPWWRFAPEHWLYPLQVVVVGGLLIWLWPRFEFRPVRGLWLATVLGVVGIVFWLLPAFAYQKLVAGGVEVPEWASWFGLAAREEGFTPEVFEGQPWAQAHTLVWRFLRMVVIVSLVEEILWRGFLMRYVQADGGDFRKVPFGQHSWAAYGVVTGCFMLAHNPEDWLGAAFFGTLMYVVAIRTKSLAACVWMHAVANLLLGIYVVLTKQWGFW
ncbi:CAAX prenyl protease-related protein [Phragmitibacter flavus]|uniref:CAAX prenyl protease-related protein n=1 Tax=Phragmitibacter flavus TaxID=2576071 RepID=A0A5R8KAN0_9BACT|nr:CAAX prenyl protease-related protein [Phragmitibacter flavus]TLD68599.1 CAAX prenyl protease-related protein [Phragmitibacter flavus]